MKSEKETIYDYAAELKLLAFKEELECTLSLAAEENWNHLQFLTELLHQTGKKPGPVWKSGNGKDAYCYGFRNKGLPTGLYRIVYFSAGPAYPDKGG